MSDLSPSSNRRASGDIVELRVHGVSGAGAADVLDRANVEQVAGDRSAGFYRPRPGYPDTAGPSGGVLEAYRWSDLPSGTATRTLSLVFLLPFMLSNVAIWMRPADRGSGAGVKVLCRLVALNLTLLYVLSAAGVALDLIAWKCMASSRCLAGRTWLSWLGDRPVGLRLAVLALAPVAAIGLVWWLGARPGHSYDMYRVSSGGPVGDRLDAEGQWNGMPLSGRLRAIHVAAALGMLDLILLVAWGAAGPTVVVMALGMAAGALLVVCGVLLCTPALLERASAGGAVDKATSALCATACGLTLATLVAIVLDRARWPHSAGLPGYHELVAWVFAAQMALLVALVLLVLRRGGRTRQSALLRGLGSPVIAAVAVGLAGAFSANLVYRATTFLNRHPLRAAPGELAAPPSAYKWAILAVFLTMIAEVVVGGGTILLSRRARFGAAAAIVARDFPAAPPEAGARLRRVEKSITRAKFTEWLLGPLAIAYACLASIGLAASVLGLMNQDPILLAERVLRIPSGLVVFGLTVGGYVTVGFVVALVIGGLFAYRTAEFRRYVGVLWDLGTFWPRAAHPFAPPCYAERAVPELAKRIRYLTDRHDRVLLTGHSHGSVLLAATVLQLPPQVTDRVALLTHGSPLNRLYARLFPAYLGQDVLHQLGDRIGWRWVNLWRDTDPIGGWIFSGHRPGDPSRRGGASGSVDRRVRDPRDVVPPPSDIVPPPITGHWPCESDEPFVAAVRELAGRLRGTSGG